MAPTFVVNDGTDTSVDGSTQSGFSLPIYVPILAALFGVLFLLFLLRCCYAYASKPRQYVPLSPHQSGLRPQRDHASMPYDQGLRRPYVVGTNAAVAGGRRSDEDLLPHYPRRAARPGGGVLVGGSADAGMIAAPPPAYTPTDDGGSGAASAAATSASAGGCGGGGGC